MSLLTPPHTSHRSDKNKENKFFSSPEAGPSTRSVVWAEENIIHSLDTPIKEVSFSSKQRLSVPKSILKLNTNSFLQIPVAPTRETTPEPSDPLVDLHYLDHPVQQILSNGTDDEEALRELIVGYNVLAARLRTSVTESTDGDASWPIFQPLRKQTQAFTDAIVRDIKRALVNPLSCNLAASEEHALKLPKCSLPSPASSPVKKKGGLSEEQVKYARDLSTTSHSALKFIAAIFCVPAIFRVFEESQLSDILTAALAIPLADHLPTPNARKTCALAISLLQTQRLPSQVLKPAAPRIAYALRRGIDGELGKEGKKGSGNDGLKAIHDLSVYLPDVFIPVFTPLLPSVLRNLLAPTLALRTQACHALGGIVNGSIAIPTSSVHTKMSSMVAAYITTPSPSPGKLAKPAQPPVDAAIVRTLRTTMFNAEPVHVASGPVWAICVIASFIVLIGPRLYSETKLNRILSTLLSHGLRSPKASLRALTCAAWRTITWAYLQPPLPVEDGEESEVDEESYMRSKQARLAHCKVMLSVVDSQAGASTIAALLADESAVTEEPLRLAIDILYNMASKAGQTCQEGIEVLHQMTSGSQPTTTFNLNMLVSSKLFSAYPGLLSAEFRSLGVPVRAICEQLPSVEEIRGLTKEQMTKPWVFRGMMVAWRTSLGCLEMEDQAEVPENLSMIWKNLLQANLCQLEEDDDEDAIVAFAASTIKYIIHVLEDPKLNLLPGKSIEKVSIVATATAAALADPTPGSDETVPELRSTGACTNGELRMRIIQHMWSTMVKVFPSGTLRECGETFLASLRKNEDSLVRGKGTTVLVEDEDAIDRTRAIWVALCVDVMLVCGDADLVKVFWNCEEDTAARAYGRHSTNWNREYTNAVWKTFVEKWREGDGNWEGGVVLLGVPFTDNHTWGLTSDDYTLWEDFMRYTASKALDFGMDSAVILDKISSFVSCFQTPGASPASGLRLVDCLLSNLDAQEMRELPTNILELASETMHALYPLESKFKQFGMWMIRSLTTVIEHCPTEFALQMLQVLQDGLCLWLADKKSVWTENELTYDIIPLYQHIVLKVQVLPECLETLTATATILDSVFNFRTPTPAAESFAEFWNLTYSRTTPPAGGWPKAIYHCLVAAGIGPEGQPIEESTSTPVDAPTSPLASTFAVDATSPRTPISSSFSTPPSAIVRREVLSRVQSPQTPHKVFGSFPIVPSTPPSPVNHRRNSGSSSVRRTPLSAIQLVETPSKRRRLMDLDDDDDDKENCLHADKITSVVDRIAGLGLRKRRHEEDEDEDARAVEKPTPKKLRGKMKSRMKPAFKKPRFSSPAPSITSLSSNESEDERRVEAELVEALTPTANRAAEAANEMISTAVPVPRRITRSYSQRQKITLADRKEIQRSIQSFDTMGETHSRKIDLSKMKLRKSTSIPEVLLSSVNHRKRKSRASDGVASDTDTNIALNIPPGIRFGPPRRYKRVCPMPSSDSDMTANQPMSSDDDPHYGQVTPHHLISPALSRRPNMFSGGRSASSSRPPRLRELFAADIPGSDDSVSSSTSSSWEPESPTKEFMTRHLHRSDSSVSLAELATLK